MIGHGAAAGEIALAVSTGATTAVEVARATLAEIAVRNPAYNAFTEVTAARALAEAEAVDAAIAAGHGPGPLAGVPYAVKNLFDVAGHTTLAGARINAEDAPAASDATAVSRLRAAGAVLVGMLNMDEYAYGFTTENAHYGTTRNPHASNRIAGGSSGGCGAAVAAGLVPLAIGSDTNGSIRVPSALCGVFGLKPTYGRLSRAGTFPFVESLDHIGPFARNSHDLACAYDAMQGPDTRDPACAQRAAQLTVNTLPRGSTPIGQETFTLRGRELPLRPNMGLLTQPLSFIGLPVVSAPLVRPGLLPLGVQIVAPAWREDFCLRVAWEMEVKGLAFSNEPQPEAIAA